MTKAGIEHDLKVSPYVFEGIYSDGLKLFYFSSKAALEKFEAGRDKHNKDLCYGLSARFKMRIILDQFFTDVDLYRRLERRGFYIETEGGAIENIKLMSYEGGSVTISI